MPFSPQSERNSSVSSRTSGWSTGRSGNNWGESRHDHSNTASSMAYTDAGGTDKGQPLLGRRDKLRQHIAPTNASALLPPDTPGLLNEFDAHHHPSDEVVEGTLFSYTSSKLRQVQLKIPHFEGASRHPDVLRQKMFSVVFDWEDDAESLIRQERAQYNEGSYAHVLLTSWLGRIGVEDMAYLKSSKKLTQADWMLFTLALIDGPHGRGVQAMVQLLLSQGNIHPAVAVLLSLGECNEAIEVYVSQGIWMEAVLLACMTFPHDWQRISQLLKKWGESEVHKGNAVLAVRCLSCATLETTEPWFSPRATDAVYAAQQEQLFNAARVKSADRVIHSAPDLATSGRLTVSTAGLRLRTDRSNDLNLDSEDDTEAMTARAGPLTAIERRHKRFDVAAVTLAKERKYRLNRGPATPKRIDGITLDKRTNRGPRTPLAAGASTRSDISWPAEPQSDGKRHLPAQSISNRRDLKANDPNKLQRSVPLTVSILSTAIPALSTDGRSFATESAFSPGPPTGSSTRSIRSVTDSDYISSLDEARNLARRQRGDGVSVAKSRSHSTVAKTRTRMTPGISGASLGSARNPLVFPIQEESHGMTTPGQSNQEDRGRVSKPDNSPSSEREAMSPRVCRSGDHRLKKRHDAGNKTPANRPAPIKTEDKRGRSQIRLSDTGPRSPSLPLLSSKRYGEDESRVMGAYESSRIRARSQELRPGKDSRTRVSSDRNRTESTSSNAAASGQRGNQINAGAVKSANEPSGNAAFATPSEVMYHDAMIMPPSGPGYLPNATPKEQCLSFGLPHLVNTPENERADAVGPLLPRTVFHQPSVQPLLRSASAPPEKQIEVLSIRNKATIASQYDETLHESRLGYVHRSQHKSGRPLAWTNIDAALHDFEAADQTQAVPHAHNFVTSSETTQPMRLPTRQDRSHPWITERLEGAHSFHVDERVAMSGDRPDPFEPPRSTTAIPGSGKQQWALRSNFANIPSRTRDAEFSREHDQAQAAACYNEAGRRELRMSEITIAPSSFPTGPKGRSRDLRNIRANMPPTRHQQDSDPFVESGGFL